MGGKRTSAVALPLDEPEQHEPDQDARDQPINEIRVHKPSKLRVGHIGPASRQEWVEGGHKASNVTLWDLTSNPDHI